MSVKHNKIVSLSIILLVAFLSFGCGESQNKPSSNGGESMALDAATQFDIVGISWDEWSKDGGICDRVERLTYVKTAWTNDGDGTVNQFAVSHSRGKRDDLKAAIEDMGITVNNTHIIN